jgi:hypothetical protein
MRIYLDANLVEYTVEHEDFIFQQSDECPVAEPQLRREVNALCQLVELDQYGEWTYVAPTHLLDELRSGHPTRGQLALYRVLEEAWLDCLVGQEEPTDSEICRIEKSVHGLCLKDSADRRHLAEALARHASWFLTNDRDIVRKTHGKIGAMRTSRPSECLWEISVGLFLR